MARPRLAPRNMRWATAATTQENPPCPASPPSPRRLISADSHVHFTDDWVKARLPNRLHAVWDEAVKKQSIFDAT